MSIKGGTEFAGIDLVERGDFVTLRGSAIASNLPAHIPQRISARANNVLYSENLPGAVQPIREGGQSTGVGIYLAAMYENGTAGFSGDASAWDACSAFHHVAATRRATRLPPLSIVARQPAPSSTVV